MKGVVQVHSMSARAVVVAVVMVVGMLAPVGIGHAAPAADEDLAAGTPCTIFADACVDLAAKQAWLIDGNGEVLRGPVPIAHGRPGYETPRGTFKVQWMNRDHRSTEFDNAPMPYAVFFTDTGIAFHQGDVGSTSHGCVRLAEQDAAAFFDFLEVDDEVQVR